MKFLVFQEFTISPGYLDSCYFSTCPAITVSANDRNKNRKLVLYLETSNLMAVVLPNNELLTTIVWNLDNISRLFETMQR